MTKSDFSFSFFFSRTSLERVASVAIFILLARSALHLGHGGATNLHKMQKTLQTGVKISLERIVAAGSQRRRLEGRVSDAPWRSRRAGGTVWDAAALHSAPPIIS